jgi:hypothetical protein
LDGPDHDRAALVADLEYAAKLGSRILIAGDIFTLILPKDKRSSGRHRERDGLDAIVDKEVNEAAEVLMPYADLVDMLGVGNHDVVALREYYTDAVNRVRFKLQEGRSKKLQPIRHGGYTGFIIMNFAGRSRHRTRDIWYWHHGRGGGAEVTKGMIDMNRVIAGNRASVYWIGHKHTNAGDIPRIREVDHFGKILTKSVVMLFTAGYGGQASVEEYEETGYRHDWSEESFYQPASQGCALLRYEPRTIHAGNIVLDRFVDRPVRAVEG